MQISRSFQNQVVLEVISEEEICRGEKDGYSSEANNTKV